MTDPVRDLLAWLATFGLTGLAAVGIAYWAFKLFAKGWIEGQFDKDLAAFRAVKDQELERLRGEIARRMDRATKFHEREYQVLPEAWGLLNRAYGAVGGAVSAYQEFPDLNRMTSDQLEEFLQATDLPESQKESIRSEGDRVKIYSKIRTWLQISEAFKAQQEFQSYIILQGVFIDNSINEKLVEASTLLRSAAISRRINEDSGGNNDLWESAHSDFKKVGPLVEQIKDDVRKRLWAIEMPDK